MSCLIRKIIQIHKLGKVVLNNQHISLTLRHHSLEWLSSLGPPHRRPMFRDRGPAGLTGDALLTSLPNIFKHTGPVTRLPRSFPHPLCRKMCWCRASMKVLQHIRDKKRRAQPPDTECPLWETNSLTDRAHHSPQKDENIQSIVYEATVSSLSSTTAVVETLSPQSSPTLD